MTLFVAALMILVSAAVIALPLLRPTAMAEVSPDIAGELHQREKNAALLAIREADFDRAMGKLSDEDHASLRQIYEERALGAMNALKTTQSPESASPASDGSGSSGRAAFCVRCGDAFAKADKFCSGCGSERPRLKQPA